MTNSNLEKVQNRLQKDFGPFEEWDYVKSVVDGSDELERLSILKWVFSASPAYWDTRARAGILLLQKNESEVWRMIEILVASADPDDNGTALTFFEITNDPRGNSLAKRWLENDDTHPATQLEAIDFLQDKYPKLAQSRLQLLLNHDNPMIQKSATRLLSNLNQNDH